MMESIKPSNGYGQLELEQLQDDSHHHQPPPPQPHRHRPLILLALAALFLLLLLIAIIASTSHHHHNHNHNHDDLISPAEEALTIVCNVTDHPDTCVSSITSLESSSENTTTDPNMILALSLQATLNSLEYFLSAIRARLVGNINETETTELENCVTIFEDPIHNLNFSVSVIETISEGNDTVSGTELGYVGKLLGDMAAKQEECMRNLTTGDAVEGIRDAMGNCSVLIGNSLAIVTNFTTVLERFNGNVAAAGGGGRRRLLVAPESGDAGGGGRKMGGLRSGKRKTSTKEISDGIM